MPTVRIDDEVYDELKKQAEPFVDSPNSVLRRLLGLDPKSGEDSLVLAEIGSGPNSDSLARSGIRERKPQARKTKARPRTRGGRRGPRSKQARSGALLPEQRYELPLLRVLVQRGGSARVREAIEAVAQELADELTEVDRQRLKSGGIRWQSRVQFVRLRLVEKGLISKDSPRGEWAITDEGRRIVEASQS